MSGPIANPLVSIIIPAYNAEKYIRESLESALAQTYQPTEVIVVDDGSKDDTERVVREFGPKVHFVKQANQGCGAARNTGVKIAKGEYVAFLDADDIWHPTKLEKQVAVFLRHRAVKLVSTRFQEIDPEGRRLPVKPPSLPSGYYDQPVDLYQYFLMRGNCLGAATTVIEKQAFIKAGQFYSKERIVSEDYDLWLRLSSANLFYILSEPLTYYRVLPDSLLHGSLEKEYGSELKILEMHRPRYTDEQFRKRLSWLYYDWASSSFHLGEAAAWGILRKSIEQDHWNFSAWKLGAAERVKAFLRALGLLNQKAAKP